MMPPVKCPSTQVPGAGQTGPKGLSGPGWALHVRCVVTPVCTGMYYKARVAELVDALDLGSSAARRGGSSPFLRTIWLVFLILTFL